VLCVGECFFDCLSHKSPINTTVTCNDVYTTCIIYRVRKLKVKSLKVTPIAFSAGKIGIEASTKYGTIAETAVDDAD